MVKGPYGQAHGKISGRVGRSLLHTLVLRRGLVPKFCFGSIIGIAMGLSRIDTLSCSGLLETKRLWFQTILIGLKVSCIGNLSSSQRHKSGSQILWPNFLDDLYAAKVTPTSPSRLVSLLSPKTGFQVKNNYRVFL